MITDDSSLFDSLNQDILNLGFTTQTLSRLETLTRQVNDVTALSERIPQAQQSGLSKGSTVLTAERLSVEDVLRQSRMFGRSTTRMILSETVESKNV